MAAGTLSQAVQDRLDAFNAADAILAAAQAEGRLPTEEEEAQIAAHQATAERAARIEAAERRQADLRALNGAPVTAARIEAIHDRELDKPWSSFGEFLRAVANAASPGGRTDPRLFSGPSGAGESVPSDGGFLVRSDYSTALLDAAIEEAVLAPRCLPIEIGAESDGIDMPYIDETSRANGSRWGGVQVYWRAEADTVTASKPKFAEHELRLQELMGIAYATDRLVRDATALESIFRAAFTSEMAFKLDDAIFRGSGVGQPLGITDSNGPRVEQAKETGQAADTVVHENISKMWQRVRTRSKGRGIWLYNSEVAPQLDALYVPAGTAGLNPRVVTYAEDGTIRIKGRPAVEVEFCAALGDAGDLVFADFSRYVLIRKGGIAQDESMHVRFLYGEKTFRWTYRVNGRPIDRTALTPYKGSNTQSAFVTLAARA